MLCRLSPCLVEAKSPNLARDGLTETDGMRSGKRDARHLDIRASQSPEECGRIFVVGNLFVQEYAGLQDWAAGPKRILLSVCIGQGCVNRGCLEKKTSKPSNERITDMGTQV